ncbi:MAG: hypothetical protein Q8Q02_06910 [Nocardioides sp.]|nr:hypothetical protein [Nocardioides sp.]
MGRHSGTRASRSPRRTSPAALLTLALGATATLVAWGYLASAAITFGVLGRSGNGGAWLLMALAALGATACLFVALILLTRVLRGLGVVSEPGLARGGGGGGRRANR